MHEHRQAFDCYYQVVQTPVSPHTCMDLALEMNPGDEFMLILQDYSVDAPSYVVVVVVESYFK